MLVFTSTLDENQAFIEETHKKITIKYNEIKKLEEEIKTYQEALYQVRNIEDMRTPFEDLFKARFVALRFGKLPVDLADRLRFYEQKPFIFLPIRGKKMALFGAYI